MPKRLDVQGLRAVAVLLVVLYHAGVPWIPGGYIGVDVFFVISGFLITGGLVRELEASGSVSWTGFYARRARRILPAATLALVTVVVLTLLFLPAIRRDSIGWDVVASALYVQNWRLDAVSTDYLTANTAASPLQHFWSLAVEEQFYVLWPLALILVGLAVTRIGRHRGIGSAEARRKFLTPLLLLVVALAGLPSLAASVLLTAQDASAAYFVTHTRLWELALGAALAIIGPQVARLGRTLAWILGWAGLAAIAIAATTYTDSTPFPGYHALLPTLGAAAVIAAGLGGADARGPVAVLGRRPMTALGDISYSYYLWHWPLIVVARSVIGREDFTVVHGLLTVAFALVPSWLSYRYVERPALAKPVVGKEDEVLFQGGILMLAAAVAGLALVLTVFPRAPIASGGVGYVSQVPTADGAEVTPVGAMVLDAQDPAGDPAGDPVDEVDTIFPQPGSSVIAGCPTLTDEVDVSPCSYGSSTGDADVVLLGDSHAAQWATALRGAATTQGWKVTEYTKQSCPAAGVPVLNAEDQVNELCAAWFSEALDEILAAQPDVVLVSGVDRPTIDGDGDVLDEADSVLAQAAGYESVWKRLTDSGIEVAAIRDTPRPGFDVPDCVSQNSDQLTECSFGSDYDNGQSLVRATADAGVPLIDLNDAICPGDRCAAVIGGYLVYNDDNHMTATYGATMADRLAAAMMLDLPALAGDANQPVEGDAAS